MAKVYDNATDLITFARSSSGTALRRVGYGDELVVDGAGNWVGDFDVAADLDEWGQGGTTLVSVSGGTATVSYNGGNATLSKIITVTAGRVYRVTGSISNVVSTGPRFKLGSSAGATDYFNAQAAGDYDEIIVATSGTLSIYVQCIGAGSLDLDNVSVKEVIFDRATDDLVLFNHPDDIPRIEYAADGSLKGLLIEEQRANLFNYSNDPNLVDGGGSGLTVSANTEDDPAGSAAASIITAQSVSSFFGPRYTSGATGQVYTASFIVKNNGSAQSRILVRNSVTAADITVSWDGATLTSTTDTSGSSSMEPLGGNYYKISVTYTATEGTQRPRIYPDTIDGSNSLVVYAWQLEEGSFPTSYIPTSNGQKTRDPDIASIPVSAFGYNQEAGTWFMEWDCVDPSDVQANYVLSSGNNARVLYNNANSPAWYAYDGASVSTYTSTAAITSDGSSIKTAFAEDDNGSSTAHTGFLGGGSGNSDLLPNYNPTYGWSIGCLQNTSYFLNGHIKSLSYFPRRLTDAQLQELTA